jgi:putative FmdB family regulatory protein
MPIYEYRCTACGHELEKLQRLSDAPLSVCPDCGEADLQPGFGRIPAEGGGWYRPISKRTANGICTTRRQGGQRRQVQ